MSNISNYSNAGSPVNPTSYAKLNNTTEKIEKFAEYLHEFLPVLEKEFDDLEKLSVDHSNAVFPIKMQALADIYRAAEPLYEWYVVKRKNRG
jgi:hypothetical protein